MCQYAALGSYRVVGTEIIEPRIYDGTNLVRLVFPDVWSRGSAARIPLHITLMNLYDYWGRSEMSA